MLFCMMKFMTTIRLASCLQIARKKILLRIVRLPVTNQVARKSSRSKPESCCPKFIVVLPEILSHVTRNFIVLQGINGCLSAQKKGDSKQPLQVTNGYRARTKDTQLCRLSAWKIKGLKIEIEPEQGRVYFLIFLCVLGEKLVNSLQS